MPSRSPPRARTSPAPVPVRSTRAVASVWGAVEASCSRRVFTLRRSWSKVRRIHQPKAGVSRRRNPWGRSWVRRNTSQRPEMSWIFPSVWASRARDRLIAVHERGRSIFVSSINASPTPRPNVTRNLVPAATGSGVIICARSIWGFHRGSFLTSTMMSKISSAGAAMSIAFSTPATSNRPRLMPVHFPTRSSTVLIHRFSITAMSSGVRVATSPPCGPRMLQPPFRWPPCRRSVARR